MSTETLAPPVHDNPSPLRRRGIWVPAALGLLALVGGALALVPRSHPALRPSVLAAAPANTNYGGGITMGPQAMEGDLKLSTGQTLTAGYDFTVPGFNGTETVAFTNVSWTFPWTCTTGTATGVVTLTAPDQSYTVTGSGWFPSGDQKSALTMQSTTFTNGGAQCPAAQMRFQKGGTFKANVFSTLANKINIRWHYVRDFGRSGATSGSWSGTASVNPDINGCYPVSCV